MENKSLSDTAPRQRILSGMRPTGELHLGHLCGVLDNWLQLQHHADCYFFVADFHALTTDYDRPGDLAAQARELVATWLAAGIDGARATVFIQSHIPEHAELHVLLSMLCPLQKLMQLPTYKEQKENLQRNLDTYGFLGYPLLQTADILAYRPTGVPVGEDQRPHVEFTRELARRFNYFYGRGDAFNKRVAGLLATLTDAQQKDIATAKRNYQQDGEEDAIHTLLTELAAQLPADAHKILRGHCLSDAEEILPPPDVLLTAAPKLLGTDGRKMSKSYDNTIGLFAEPDVVDAKLKTMKTDPVRIRRSDPGNPDHCPVWELHQTFADDETQAWVREGCTSANIGCVDCKKKIAGVINTRLQPLRDRRRELDQTTIVDDVIADGNRRARAAAGETLAIVRAQMGLGRGGSDSKQNATP